MKITKRQLQLIIREEKQKLQEMHLPDSQTGTSLAENLHMSIIDLLNKYLEQYPSALSFAIQDKIEELVAKYTNGQGLE